MGLACRMLVHNVSLTRSAATVLWHQLSAGSVHCLDAGQLACLPACLPTSPPPQSRARFGQKRGYVHHPEAIGASGVGAGSPALPRLVGRKMHKEASQADSADERDELKQHARSTNTLHRGPRTRASASLHVGDAAVTPLTPPDPPHPQPLIHLFLPNLSKEQETCLTFVVTMQRQSMVLWEKKRWGVSQPPQPPPRKRAETPRPFSPACPAPALSLSSCLSPLFLLPRFCSLTN